jgi:hypothetical protein
MASLSQAVAAAMAAGVINHQSHWVHHQRSVQLVPAALVPHAQPRVMPAQRVGGLRSDVTQVVADVTVLSNRCPCPSHFYYNAPRYMSLFI